MQDRRPTVTAAVVAATLLLLRDDPALAALVPSAALPDVEAAVRSALPELAVLLDHVPWPLLAGAARAVERVASPGFALHYALRKHRVRSEVLAAVNAGYAQVVLLGAGFDMLGQTLGPAATVFEVDHPRTQAGKRRAVRASDVRYVPVDLLTESLEAALVAGGVARDADTVIAAEGLFMYFEKPQVAALLDALTRTFRGRRRLVATFLTPDRRGRVRIHSQRAIVDLVMERLGEAFAFGTTPAGLVELLGAHGFAASELVSTLAEAERLVPAIAGRLRATGELVVTAEGKRVDAVVGPPRPVAGPAAGSRAVAASTPA